MKHEVVKPFYSSEHARIVQSGEKVTLAADYAKDLERNGMVTSSGEKAESTAAAPDADKSVTSAPRNKDAAAKRSHK